MANQGKNKSNSKNKSKSSSSTRASSAKKSGTAKKNSATKTKNPTYFDENYLDNETSHYDDLVQEIALWLFIGFCLLLFISNLGFGGRVGDAVTGFFFGCFGLIQYVIPILLMATTVYLSNNRGDRIAIAKVIVGILLCIVLCDFIELLSIGQEAVNSASTAFVHSKETHFGGGFFGGGIAYFLTANFSLVGAYLITIIIGAVSVIFIVECSLFEIAREKSQSLSDRRAIKKRQKREERSRQREELSRYNDERTAIQSRVGEDYNRQLLEEENANGPRRDRKRSGVTRNTTLAPSFDETLPYSNDDVNEIRFNMGNHGDIEVTQTSRHKLTSGKNSVSRHGFDVNAPVEPVSSSYKEPVATPRINMPTSEAIIAATGADLMASVEVNNTPETMRKPKPSVATKEEIDVLSSSISMASEADKTKPKRAYKKPPLTLLNNIRKDASDSQAYLAEMSHKLQRTLSNFGVEAKVDEVTLGPSVTQYKISINQGTKVSKVLNLADDIKLNMAVTDVRIEAPIPGEPFIGIEVPNKTKTMVGFKELVSHNNFTQAKSKVSFCVGKDIQGRVIVGNIEKMPHLLIAGATGSGKSVCINTIIMSILYHATPDEVKLIMVDPKMVELSVYNGIPHLLIPVVTDAKKAAGALHWAVKEMTDRYELLALAGVRNIEGFNEKVENETLPDSVPESKRVRMCQIVIILDELADLMMVAAADVEDSIVRLAQLARAAGIHLIIATQRPTANVITGLIKANVPSRIAFSVSSAMDSRVILDMNGAEDLLGNGDMLYAPQNESKPIRVQGAFVSDDEVARVVDFLKNNNDTPEDNKAIVDAINSSDSSNGSVQISGDYDDSRDGLFAEAGRLVIESQKGSIGYLQRNFRIGFNRAARIMDQLCEAGVVGPEMGTKPREIRMSLGEFEEYLNQQ